MTTKMALSLEQTRALYCINKWAKVYRDRRQTIIDIINRFLEKGEAIDNLAEEEITILNRIGLDSPVELKYPDHIDGFDSYWDWVHKREDDNDTLFYSISESDISFAETNHDLYQDCEIHSMINMWTTAQDMVEWGLSASTIQLITEIQDDIRGENELIHQNNVTINKVKFLRQKVKRLYSSLQDRLYSLKDVVLAVTDATPVAYHYMEHYKEPAALYEINGFKFHMFVDEDEIEEDQIDDSVRIDKISAVNTLDEPMPVDKAVGILLEYLGYSPDMASNYLEGSGPDICGDLGLYVITPTKKRKNQSREYWDDDYRTGYWAEDDNDYY